MWISLCEVSKKVGIGEVLQAGRIIGHYVVRSWDVEGLVAVAMLVLVQAGAVAEVRRRAIAGHSPFRDSGDGRGVVRAGGDGGAGDVVRGLSLIHI